MFKLTNKTALITGASGGIGEAIAHHLAAQGVNKMVISGTRKEKLQQLANAISAANGNDIEIYPLTCNLADKQDINNLLDGAAEKLQRIDILVCNAGITRDNLAMRMKDEEWQQVLQVNLEASFYLNRGVLRSMMKQKFGRIINITSVVGTMGNAGQANYCASKGGLQAMSKAIAQEVASRSITVNCVAPGFIKTPMTDALDEKQAERITANIPAARFGLPEDVAACVAFLASDEASYITGQTLHVNGGLLMV